MGGQTSWCGEQASLFGEEQRVIVMPRPLSGSAGKVALTPDVEELLKRNAVAACAVSGGKDGTAMALAVARHLDAIGHTGPRVLIHSDLGRVEWKDSLPACERLAKAMGWELMVVRRKAGDMLARWEGRWAANVARYEALQSVKIILPWSTPSMRFCTAELKANLIASELKKRFPGQDILNIVGIRREESATRSKMPVSSVNPRLVRRGKTGTTWNAIIEWSVGEVWAEIRASGVEPHEAYGKYGSTRVSCAYCIMSSGADLMAAAGCEDNHDVYRQMVTLEAESTFGFQGGRWLADVAPQLLGDDLTRLVKRGKEMAIERQAAEAEIPKHLLYVKGWPTAVPSLDEAKLLATVRQRVGEALNLQVMYATPEEVRARYSELLKAGTPEMMEGEAETEGLDLEMA